MKELNKEFWIAVGIKYPDEVDKFLRWVNDYFSQFKISSMQLFRYDTIIFSSLPPSFQLGLFIQYTLEQPQKRNWFHITGHGSVTEQITRWFEMEYRKSDPSISDEVAKVTEEFKKTFLPTQL